MLYVTIGSTRLITSQLSPKNDEMTDRQFELTKLLIDKLLLAGIAGIIVFVASLIVKDYEANRATVEKFHERKGEVALRLATHCSSLAISKTAIHDALASLVDAIPSGSMNAASSYIKNIIPKSIAPFVSELNERNKEISKFSVETELFLGQGIGDAYFDFLDTVYPNDPIPDISAFVEKMHELAQGEQDIRALRLGLRNYVKSLKPRETIAEKYGILINKLRDVIPQLSRPEGDWPRIHSHQPTNTR